ncbi:MAG: FG-GAP-like repeat-containing protein [Candidatus Latescibacterota bacterium]
MTTRQFCRIAGAVLGLCGPAAGQTFFVEVADSVFVETPFTGWGVAWGDYDSDGWVDLLMAESHDYIKTWTRLGLWDNEGGRRFTDDGVAAEAAAASPQVRMGAGSGFGDYDNDGDLDAHVSVGSYVALWRELNLLLRNDRGVLTNVNRAAGLTDSLPTDNALWLDYDRDGHLDLYTGNPATGNDIDADPGNDSDPTVRNRLYRNRGDGTFVDVTSATGLDLPVYKEGGYRTSFMSLNGGSGGGMAAADFNDDGWPDLYLGVGGDRNRLFLSDGEGGFRDATTDEIGDEGTAFGVAVGDIDNDGDLDLFQAAGGHTPGWEVSDRSLLLLNLGAGEFVDITEGAGLAGRLTETEANGPILGDLDNDGDLDLLIGSPHYLFLNDGTGFFIDETSRSGILRGAWSPFLADYDRDGFLDVCLAFARVGSRTTRFGGLYHNQGNGNHWLEVEPVGVRSNRSGIGARVIATSGTLRQTREILGGTGFSQEEMMAHFGLGERTTVDQLEIRWPWGQVDVLTDVPADQRIRVFEGESAYFAPQPATAEFPDTLVVGAPSDFRLRVAPMRLDPEARITRVVADLSALGGPSEAPLRADGEAAYALRLSLPPPASNGLVTLSVLVDQDTRLGPQWSRLTRSVWVLPAGDLVIYDEALAPGWEVVRTQRVEELELAATASAQVGSRAAAVRGKAGGWNAKLQASSAVAATGYRLLRFAFHPGDAVLPARRPLFTVRMAQDGTVDLLADSRIDFARAAWQEVEVPLAELSAPDSVRFLEFAGTSAGTFYLDDIRLVAERPSAAPGTAVREARTAAVPQALALQPNYPNPFNSGTTLRFDLPQAAAVELAVYNLAGQKVATLVQGEREAGGYTVTWDGRDTAGRPLGSGVYLCQLRASGQARGQVDTRKLLLLR